MDGEKNGNGDKGGGGNGKSDPADEDAKDALREEAAEDSEAFERKWGITDDDDNGSDGGSSDGPTGVW